MRTIRLLFVLILIGLISTVIVADNHATPSVSVSDQVSLNGAVVIDEVVSAGPAFVVIHIDNEGAPGPVIGFRQVNHGTSQNVSIPIDTNAATTTLYAMLHEDTGEAGVYEFGTVEGADGPVRVDEQVVTPSFNVEIMRAYDQLISDNTVSIASVVTAQDGFVVIHADNDGAPGPVLGSAPVSAGANADVSVELEGDVTGILFPMLHVDTGEAGVYDFGTVEGADGPVIVDGTVAVFPITTHEPSMRIADQIVTDSLIAESVVSDGPGWLVVHADNEGSPGPVIGSAAVESGTNLDVVVELDAEAVTPILFPMLHVDTGTEGEYEFGTVEGADGPAMTEDGVLVFPINAAPSIHYSGSIDGSIIVVDGALIDGPGWLVIHADNEGAPGAVLGAAPLASGLNTHIAVEIESEDAIETVFPMLHVDTGEAGVYEFGTVEGADGPVRVGENVVVGPMTPSMME